MKVVIFTEDKLGEGHYQAARALKRTLTETSSQVNVKLIGGLRSVHPVLEWSVVRIYFAMLHYAPQIWSYLYTSVHHQTLLQQLYFSYKLSRLIKREQPDLVLCTHPACVKALAHIKRQQDFKLGVIFTDFTFHPFAISPKVDYFFVPHWSVGKTLINQYHIGRENIFEFGIPIDPAYEDCTDQRRDRCGKINRPVEVLLLGGGLGLGPLTEVLNCFNDDLSEQFKLTIICGKNKSLYKKLVKRANEHVEVLGYVHDMADRIRKADAVISKPGGLTIAETLACRTPLFMLQPLPGQEEGNQRFLCQYHLGRTVNQISQLPHLLHSWLEDLEARKEWLKQVEAHCQPRPAERIALKLLSDLGGKAEADHAGEIILGEEKWEWA